MILHKNGIGISKSCVSIYRGKIIWHFPKLTITCGQFVYTMAIQDILRTSNTNMTFMPFMAHYANCTSIVSYS